MDEKLPVEFENQATDVVDAQLFDRIKNLKALLEAVNKAIAAEGVKAQVAAWLGVIALGASFTPSGKDDEMVAKIRDLLTSPQAEKIIGIIADLVGGLMGKIGTQSEEKLAEAKATAEAAAIPWAMLLTLAKFIFSLINNFNSK